MADSANPDDYFLPLILKNNFFDIKDVIKTTDPRKTDLLVAVCATCKAKIKGSIKVTSNYIQHYKTKHPEKYNVYKEEKTTFKALRQKGSKQCELDDKILNFVVSSHSPMSIVENEDFIALIKMKTDNLIVKSRKHLQDQLDDKFKRMEGNIKTSLEKVSYVCCTADIWSGKHKSFFGYTVHWINDDLSRHSAALACKRFKSPHTYTYIASLITEINFKFGLSKDKIVCIVTDNGSNFVKAFNEYGVKEFENTEDFDSEDELELSELIPETDNDISDNTEKDQIIQLAKHYRCGSHTLNLLSTTDYMKAIKDESIVYERHKSAMLKCEQIWSKSKRPKSYEKIFEILNAALKTPTVTRWNSLFDSVQHLLTFKQQFKDLTDAIDIDDFLLEDLEYLEEFVKFMKPISEALDLFQSEKNIYFGYFLPTLLTLKLKLQKIAPSLAVLGNVARKLIIQLEKRFSSIFFYEHTSREVVVAAISCPQIRFLNCTLLINVWKETSPFISELYLENIFIEYLPEDLLDHNTERINGASNLAAAHNFFRVEEIEDQVMQSEQLLTHDQIRKELRDFTIDNGTPLQDLNKYPVIKKAFFKSNTPLPSSAPVERMFSLAGLVNQQRRQRLTDSHFEEFVLSKANPAYFSTA